MTAEEWNAQFIIKSSGEREYKTTLLERGIQIVNDKIMLMQYCLYSDTTLLKKSYEKNELEELKRHFNACKKFKNLNICQTLVG